MTELCKHDWVGDDECAYCRINEMNAVFDAVLEEHRSSTLRLQQRIAELKQIRDNAMRNVGNFMIENASLKEQIADTIAKSELRSQQQFNAGMERAAEMLMHRVGNDPLLQDQTAISALVQEAKAIRKEIEK